MRLELWLSVRQPNALITFFVRIYQYRRQSHCLDVYKISSRSVKWLSCYGAGRYRKCCFEVNALKMFTDYARQERFPVTRPLRMYKWRKRPNSATLSQCTAAYIGKILFMIFFLGSDCKFYNFSNFTLKFWGNIAHWLAHLRKTVFEFDKWILKTSQ